MNMVKREFCGPLLVTGSSRSGTSFLYRLVNSIPGVQLTYEANIIKGALWEFEKRDVLASRSTFADYLDKLQSIGTKSGRNPLFEQTPEFYERLFESFREHRDFKRFIADFYIAALECKIWGDKCATQHVRIIHALFPDVRILWIVRDPRAVASSFRMHSGGNYYATSLSWVNAARQARELLDTLGTSSVCIVKYEDLVTPPHKEIRGILEFIGNYEKDDLSIIKSAHTDSISKWKNLLTTRQVKKIEEICYDEMRHYSYKPLYAEARKALNPIQYGLCSVQHTIGLLKTRPYRIRQVLSLEALVKWVKIYVNSWR